MKEKKVLVVDDAKLIRLFIEKFLAKEGWNFISVESGEEALDVVEEFQPDVITLDNVMPGLSVIDVFKELKERGFDIPVVFLTASKGDKLIKEFLKLGAFGYLTKPFRSPEINFILTKAYEYKTLKSMIDNFEKKEDGFKSLHNVIDTMADEGIDTEISRRILIDRQKAYLLDRFLTFYKNRHQPLLGNIEAIETLNREICPEREDCNHAVRELKNTIEDIYAVLTKTVEGLEEISGRIKSIKNS